MFEKKNRTSLRERRRGRKRRRERQGDKEDKRVLLSKNKRTVVVSSPCKQELGLRISCNQQQVGDVRKGYAVPVVVDRDLTSPTWLTDVYDESLTQQQQQQWLMSVPAPTDNDQGHVIAALERSTK